MAWIELHQSVRDHRKVVELASALDIPEPHAVGHLAYLWLWAVDNAPDGRLPASPRIIARAAWWEGDPGVFLEALVAAELVDRFDRECVVHDFDDYIGKLIDQRQANRERQRRHRDARRAGVTPDRDVTPARDEPTVTADRDVTVTSALGHTATQPYPTVPNPTEPERTQEEEGAAAPAPVPAPQPSGAAPVPETTSTGRREPRRSRLPDDWQLTRELRVYATNRGLTDAEIEHEAEKFRAHWAGTGEAKANWAATWQSWVLRFLDRRAGPARASPSGHRPPVPPMTNRDRPFDPITGAELPDDHDDQEPPWTPPPSAPPTPRTSPAPHRGRPASAT